MFRLRYLHGKMSEKIDCGALAVTEMEGDMANSKVSVRLGSTEIVVDKNGFGALPVQRISDGEAVKLLRKAYEGGIRFFDTARWYSDSEHKLGLAFEGIQIGRAHV